MEIFLQNTASREKEEFTPQDPGRVKIYSCGPTVYERAHIGNLRAFLLSDVLRRVFEYNDYEVTQVINITDVGHLTSDADEGEDKLEAAARSKKQSAQEIAVYFTNLFFNDIGALNIKMDRTIFPRATAHITEQINLIARLEEKGYTYQTSDGVYFDTSKFPPYADFAHLDVSGLKEGARVDIGEKRNATDFALWKFSPKDAGRQQEWASPWGQGFPGWHIECSAMAIRYLGDEFDVHTGGIDHISVHHTNEIAQSEAATGRKFVHYWLHSEFMTIEGEKMSKSIGNTFSLDDLSTKNIHPLAYRYWLLTAHYRTPLNFTWETLTGASQALLRLYKYITDLPTSQGGIPAQYAERFQEAVNDDLNTPKGLALVWELIHDEQIAPEDKYAALIKFDEVLGLDLKNAQNYLTSFEQLIPISELPPEIRELVRARENARKTKAWEEADAARLQIEEAGYHIEDGKDGPKISKK